MIQAPSFPRRVMLVHGRLHLKGCSPMAHAAPRSQNKPAAMWKTIHGLRGPAAPWRALKVKIKRIRVSPEVYKLRIRWTVLNEEDQPLFTDCPVWLPIEDVSTINDLEF